MSKKTLVELHKSNNHTTDKWGVRDGEHAYLPIYDKLFERLRERKGNILEIGAYKGDSLNLLAEYFTNSVVYGIEHKDFQIDIKLHDNVKIISRNAYTEETVEVLNKIGQFDVIIDDGSHIDIEQQFFVRHYLKLLSPDGVFVVEEAGMHTGGGSVEDQILRLINLFPDELRDIFWHDGRLHNRQWDSLLICNKINYE